MKIHQALLSISVLFLVACGGATGTEDNDASNPEELQQPDNFPLVAKVDSVSRAGSDLAPTINVEATLENEGDKTIQSYKAWVLFSDSEGNVEAESVTGSNLEPGESAPARKSVLEDGEQFTKVGVLTYRITYDDLELYCGELPEDFDPTTDDADTPCTKWRSAR